MTDITLGNALTIVIIIVGLYAQYIAIVLKLSERITKIEVKQENIEKDMNKLGNIIRQCIPQLNKVVSDDKI